MKLISTILSTFFTVILMVVIALVIFTPPKCEHTQITKHFSFQFQGSTASSNVRQYCEECNSYVDNPSLFKGNPEDLSYLEVVKAHSDGDEIVGGEYYTMTAIVTLGDYDTQKTRINCRVQSENIIVWFSVEFREEFEDAVTLLQEGDEITFRGRYYDTGCGFTDCELIGGKGDK